MRVDARWMALLAAVVAVAAGAAVVLVRSRTPSAPKEANAELERLYLEDQNDRRGGAPPAPERDAQRKNRVLALLKENRIGGAEDYERAAIILQHGAAPEDSLLAHALAVLALAQGRQESRWTAAATLDRYLQKTGQPQIFGTQYSRRGEQFWNMEPYDRGLLPDRIRALYGVPTLEQQQKDLLKMNR